MTELANDADLEKDLQAVEADMFSNMEQALTHTLRDREIAGDFGGIECQDELFNTMTALETDFNLTTLSSV